MLFRSKIYLKNVRFHAYHGVLPQETQVGNDYVVNLDVSYDFSRAMETDELAGTLNYAELYELVKQEMEIPSKLLEHVAGRIGKRQAPTAVSRSLSTQVMAVMMRVHLVLFPKKRISISLWHCSLANMLSAICRM